MNDKKRLMSCSGFGLKFFLVFCFCFAFIHCNQKAGGSGEVVRQNSKITAESADPGKGGTLFSPETIISPGPVFSVSVHNESVIWCAGGANGKLAQNIYRKEKGKAKAELIYSVSGEGAGNKQAMPVKLYGNRIAWVEYVQREDMAVIWELCTMEIGKPNSKKIAAANKHNVQIRFPRFDLEKDILVFDMLLSGEKDSYDSPLYVYRISADKAEPLLRLPGYDLVAPDIYGDEIVFCKLSVAAANRTLSELTVYNWVNRKLSHLRITENGYEPALAGKHIVFKEAASLFAYGQIKLYDRSKNTLTTLFATDPGGELPFVGIRYVVWESPFFDKIEGYDLQESKKVLFEKGNTGKPFLLDNSLVWVAEPAPGKVVIRYLNLAGG